ncbi:PRC-barrel domain-containing protein [Azospirillum agricola]|uniref:PRC-barrel domain-containing protein n=1 Tax=Azospirillum agricola TaxID=1720247 RepID=UPI000A0EF73B|nr:PRC-barrel domain-containing protein [Azospirillum agricola]SMH47556.1 PRC-barrel domain-containing protein [Azospirillum lipoferum]
MPRPLLFALPAAALLLAGAAQAQIVNPDQTEPGRSTTAQTVPPAAAPPPLMTAPRPDDRPTTDPLASPSGVGGSAPSNEVQNPSPPVASLPPDALTAPQAQAMVGTELRTRDGQVGGRILDFTMAEPDGRIARVVLAPNDVLGLGAKMVTVPVTALKMDDGTPTLDMDAAELAQAPGFAYGIDQRTLIRRQ